MKYKYKMLSVPLKNVQLPLLTFCDGFFLNPAFLMLLMEEIKDTDLWMGMKITSEQDFRWIDNTEDSYRHWGPRLHVSF